MSSQVAVEEVSRFRRGDMVVAARELNFGLDATPVAKGTLGVVYEEAGFYHADSGPSVRWFNGEAYEVFDGEVCSPEELDSQL